jgi:Putative transposase DNA-binding domain
MCQDEAEDTRSGKRFGLAPCLGAQSEKEALVELVAGPDGKQHCNLLDEFAAARVPAMVLQLGLRDRALGQDHPRQDLQPTQGCASQVLQRCRQRRRRGVRRQCLILMANPVRARKSRARRGQNFLRYKCDHAGVVFAEVGEKLTTQTCSARLSVGGPKGREGLGIRQWVCGECGTVHERDGNAPSTLLASGARRSVSNVREAPPFRAGTHHSITDEMTRSDKR